MEYPEMEGTIRITESNSWSLTGQSKIQTLCLGALSRCSINSGTWSHAHSPVVQTLSLTPNCPSPDTATCRSLRPLLSSFALC